MTSDGTQPPNVNVQVSILAEKHSHTSPEATRYSWYHNLQLKPTLKRELALRLDPFRQTLRRRRRGAAWYQEFGFSAYTCLAQGAGELKVFAKPNGSSIGIMMDCPARPFARHRSGTIRAMRLRSGR
jgi:hypothetical protein